MITYWTKTCLPFHSGALTYVDNELRLNPKWIHVWYEEAVASMQKASYHTLCSVWGEGMT